MKYSSSERRKLKKTKVTRTPPFLGKLDRVTRRIPQMKLARNSGAANRKRKNAEGKTETGRRVSGAHSADGEREDSSKGYAPSPLDFLCHPAVPGGQERGRVREERRQEEPSITRGKQRDVRGAEAPADGTRQTIRTG